MPGPMNVAVRFVTLRLCVPVSACSVEFVSVGLPNGNHPCVVPSSQSFWIDVSATATVPVSSGGAGSLEQPAIWSATNEEAKTISQRHLRIQCSPSIDRAVRMHRRYRRLNTFSRHYFAGAVCSFTQIHCCIYLNEYAYEHCLARNVRGTVRGRRKVLFAAHRAHMWWRRRGRAAAVSC